MIPVRAYRDRRVIVLGLDQAGMMAARALGAGGAQVSAWDDQAVRRSAATAAGLAVEDPTARGWGDVAALVLADAALAADADAPCRVRDMARALEIPVVTSFDLYLEASGDAGPVTRVLVCGAMAKRAAVLAAGLLQRCGVSAWAATEAGQALSLRPVRDGGVHIIALDPLEAASALSVASDMAVVLNGAGAAAGRLAVQANREVIVSIDDPVGPRTVSRLKAGGAPVIPVSGRQALGEGVYARGEYVIDALEGVARTVSAAGAIAVLRRQGDEALAAAWALVRRLGVPLQTLSDLGKHLVPPGLGAELHRLGPVSICEHGAAQSADAIAALVRSGEPVRLVLGASPADRTLMAALNAAPGALGGLYVAGRAPRASLGDRPVIEARTEDEALALALRDAMAARRRETILCAPGAPCDPAAYRAALSARAGRLLALLDAGAAA